MFDIFREKKVIKNHAENVHQKLVPDPFLILVNNPNPKQPLHARNSFRYFEIGLSNSLEKVNFYFFFGTQSLLMHKVIKTKRGPELVTGCFSGLYYLTKFDDVIQSAF